MHALIESRNWSVHLDRQAELRPDATAYEFTGAAASGARTLSFAELRRRARACAHAWQGLVGEGDRVLLCLPPGADFMVALFGCFALGAIAVPVAPPLAAAPEPGCAWFSTLVDDAQPRAVVWSPAVAELLASSWRERGSVLRIPAEVDGADAADTGAATATATATAEALAIILYTSGSTGAPKGVEIRHDGLLHNMGAFARACGRSATDRIYTWLPNVHVAGLYMRLLGVFLGCPTLIATTGDFLQSPAGWLRTISSWRATISAAPNFAYDLAEQAAAGQTFDDLDLSCWDMAVTGGEVVRLSTYERFVARFGPHGFRRAAFHPYFGLTETLCTTIPQGQAGPRILHVDRGALRDGRVVPSSPDSSDAHALVGNGAPLGDDIVVIVDPETRRVCAEGTIGEIWTSTRGNTSGYWRRPELSAELCRARVTGDAPDHDRAYFRTGDLGFTHEGSLFVTGRRKELIILHGKNYYPQDVEATVVDAIAGVSACAAFAIDDDRGEQLGVAVECGDRTPEQLRALASELRAAVYARHGVGVHRLALLTEQRLPRTSTQKLRRGACRDLLLSGAWDAALGHAPGDEPAAVPAAGDTAPSAAAIASFMRRELGRRLELDADAIDAAASLAGFGLDSVALVELALTVREFCGPRLPVEVTDFYTDASLAALADTLARGAELEAEATTIAADVRLVDELVDEPAPGASGHHDPGQGSLLLTGATGFLGRYLLHALMTETERQVLCLVRAADEPAAHARLREALAAGPGYDERWRDRIVALPGDVSADMLGLSEADYARVCAEVGAVLHNAANVDFIAPYRSLRPSNVLATGEVIRLCRRIAKPLHYVSTTGVFNSSERRGLERVAETARLEHPQRIHSGYARTKWVSEAMLDAARARGLAVAIYRPAQVSGSAARGDWNTDDFVCRFIKGCLQLGRFPACDVEVDMVPVDFVARAIVTLAQAGATSDYNLCHPRPIRLPALFEWYRAAGYACFAEPLADWLVRLDEARRDGRANALVPMLPFLRARPQPDEPTILELLDGEPSGRLDATQARAGLGRSAGVGVEPPPIDDALLRRYTEHFLSRGFFDDVPR